MKNGIGKTGRGMGARRSVRAVAAMVGLLLASALAWASGTAGVLDTGFGTSGVVVAANSAGGPTSVAQQSSGKLVHGGWENDPSVSGRAYWRLRRLAADGSLDTTFGASGEVHLFGDHGYDALWHLVTDASDRIVCVGQQRIAITTGTGRKQSTTYSARLTVARLLADGALDTTFGSSGVTSIAVPGADFSGSGKAKAVRILSDGSILVAGIGLQVVATSGKGKKTSRSDAIVLARLSASGALDTAFGSGGIVVHDATAGDDEVWTGALEVQSTGRIVVGGLARDLDERWVLTAYDSDGSVDATFGRVTQAGAFLRGIATDASDRILVCGWLPDGLGSSDGVLVRYDADGGLDTGFGSGGATVVAPGERVEMGPPLVQADGKIVCAANIMDADEIWRCLPVRFTSAGALDSGFGTGGFGEALEDPVLNHLIGFVGILDANGDIVFTGVRWDSGVFSGEDWTVARWFGGT